MSGRPIRASWSRALTALGRRLGVGHQQGVGGGQLLDERSRRRVAGGPGGDNEVGCGPVEDVRAVRGRERAVGVGNGQHLEGVVRERVARRRLPGGGVTDAHEPAAVGEKPDAGVESVLSLRSRRIRTDRPPPQPRRIVLGDRRVRLVVEPPSPVVERRSLAGDDVQRPPERRAVKRAVVEGRGRVVGGREELSVGAPRAGRRNVVTDADRLGPLPYHDPSGLTDGEFDAVLSSNPPGDRRVLVRPGRVVGPPGVGERRCPVAVRGRWIGGRGTVSVSNGRPAR